MTPKQGLHRSLSETPGHRRRISDSGLPRDASASGPSSDNAVDGGCSEKVRRDNASAVHHRASGTSLPTPSGDEGAPAPKRRRGFRRDYSLGDPLRSPSHMVVEPSPGRAARAAGSLRAHDFAFVRRTGGGFSYAVLAYRRSSAGAPPDGEGGGAAREDADGGRRDKEEEERRRRSLTFVVGRRGETKTVGERHWGACVRLVRTAGAADEEDDARSRPTVVSFAQEMHDDEDECSMLSSVSDRVRARRRGRAR